ncbi:MAG: hypothetical protein KatS3mg051_1564 [Anaerolineae bacterium]|nr:MAG: hypothetical protein KatS3mg051_1564 [Anaerolineae bacterium]
MTCPRCGHDRLDVYRTHRLDDAIRRERYCVQCHLHVITEERITHTLVYQSERRKTVPVPLRG